jgi:protein MAK16
MTQKIVRFHASTQHLWCWNGVSDPNCLSVTRFGSISSLINLIRPITVRINKKVDRRERRREEKAKIAAKLSASIKKELIERLHSVT